MSTVTANINAAPKTRLRVTRSISRSMTSSTPGNSADAPAIGNCSQISIHVENENAIAASMLAATE